MKSGAQGLSPQRSVASAGPTRAAPAAGASHGRPAPFPLPSLAIVTGLVEEPNDAHLLLSGTELYGIQVELGALEGLQEGDCIVISIDGNAIGAHHKVIGHPGETVTVDIPAIQLPRKDGMHILSYTLKRSEESFAGPLNFFTTDYTRPSNLPELGYTFAGTLLDPLTNADLVVENGIEYVVMTLSDYDIPTSGDRIQLLDGSAAFGTEIVLDNAMAAERPIVLRFEAEGFYRLGKGAIKLSYRVIDRAGNIGTSSQQYLYVDLNRDVIELPALIVPAQLNDGLVDHNEAHDSQGRLTILVPPSSLLKRGNRLVLSQGNVALLDHVIDEDPQDELPVFVPYDALYRLWFRSTQGADKKVELELVYTVWRNGKEAGRGTGRLHLNLYVPGGEDPDGASLASEALMPPSLLFGDYVLDDVPRVRDGHYRVLVPTHTNPYAPPVADALQPDDVIEVAYGSRSAPRVHKVTQADLDAATETGWLAIELSQVAVAKERSEFVRLTYAIKRRRGDGGYATAFSQARYVHVH